MTRRLAIVGLGPSRNAYIEDVDRAGDRKVLFDETWTFNSFCSIIQSDRLFHMDDVLIQGARADAGNLRVKHMLEAMKLYKGPIYTSFPEPEYPTMLPYPIKEIAQKFNSFYFSTTPPYAAALAAYEQWEEVTLYGMDYTWPGVAGAEAGRGCMEYWVGRMHGLGMKVRIPAASSLMDNRLNTADDIKLYGFDRVRVALELRGLNAVALQFHPKVLPTAKEIEERYSHRKPASEVALDVVN